MEARAGDAARLVVIVSARTIGAALAVALVSMPVSAQPPVPAGSFATPPAPCAACVSWRTSPAVARAVLETPGRLDGLDVIVTTAAPEDGAMAIAVARDLVARGAVAGLESPVSIPLEIAPAGGAVSRVILDLPVSATADEAMVFAIRTRATAVRADAPSAVIGLSGPADLLAALWPLVEPYVSLLVPIAVPPRATWPDGVEWWETGRAPASIPDLLARAAGLRASRVVLPLAEADVSLARAAAGLSALLPAGLAPLDTVQVCAGEDCRIPVYLHPRTLEAVALVSGGGRLQVRPGATEAHARPLGGQTEASLSVARRAEATEVDATSLAGPAVLRLAGWAGETAFSAGVEVAGTRRLTVAEIVAAHQAAKARLDARVRSLVSTGTTVLSFQVPGLAAPMTVTADTILYARGALREVEHRDLRLNGVPVAVGEDGVPRLPLVQAEPVAAAPLSITLGESYRYRLEGGETAAGQACYVVAFEPANAGGPSLRGRAWIAKDTFALVRLAATQTGLRGAIVSSREDDEFRPVEVGGQTAWLLSRSDTHQVYEGPGHRTPIDRAVVFTRIEPNPSDFEARLAAAHSSRSVLMRETAQGFEYLRRVGPRGPEAASAHTAERDGGRALGGRATHVWSVAGGVLFDPDIDQPLPFAGLGYLDFDVLHTGAQVNAFLAGPFAQLAVSVPAVGGPGLQLQATAFASLVGYNDRMFRGGLERYGENLRQRPLRASVAALQRLGPRTRLRAAYELDAVHLETSDTTSADFVVPASPVAHGLRLGLEWESGAWSASAWGSAARRQAWRAWGLPGDFDGDARAYQRAGLGLVRSFALRAGAVARLEASALAGRHLDRFSRFGFDAFDNRLRGYPSAGLRFDRAVVLRSAAVWKARPGLRLDAFVDGALVHDPVDAVSNRGHLGTGAGLEAALPGRVLLGVDWGFGWQGRGRDGRRGTQVVRITAYRIL